MLNRGGGVALVRRGSVFCVFCLVWIYPVSCITLWCVVCGLQCGGSWKPCECCATLTTLATFATATHQPRTSHAAWEVRENSIGLSDQRSALSGTFSVLSPPPSGKFHSSKLKTQDRKLDVLCKLQTAGGGYKNGRIPLLPLPFLLNCFYTPYTIHLV